MANSPAFDMLTIERVGVDTYPLDIGVGLEEVSRFEKFLGGSPTNVAVAGARYGLDCGVITRVGPDPLGKFVRSELERLGVDPGFVDDVAGLKTPVVFCEIFFARSLSALFLSRSGRSRSDDRGRRFG